MASRVSSLVWAAEGDQLNDPVITVLLSITANLCGWGLRSAAQAGFSVFLWVLEPLVEPEALIEKGTGYERLSQLGFWRWSALVRIPVRKPDLEESTNPAE